MSIDDRQELAMELYRSRHGGGTVNGGMHTGTIVSSGAGTLGRRTLGRKNGNNGAVGAAALGKSPPRPSPASVAYHSDEESLKCYDENPDDSSVTEKPSEVSSSESQVSNPIEDHLLNQFLIILFILSTRRARTKASDPTPTRLSTTTPM